MWSWQAGALKSALGRTDIWGMDDLTSVPQRMHDQHRLSPQTGICEEDGWCNLKNRGQVLEHEDLRSNFELVLAQHGIEWPRVGGDASDASDFASAVPIEPLDVVRRPFVPAPPRGPVSVPDVFAAPSGVGPVVSGPVPSGARAEGSLVVLPSTRSPGQGAKAQAVVPKKAAPVRTFVSRLLGAPSENPSLRAGSDGEEQIAHQLAKLPGGWHVFHSLSASSHASDIDHVVVGPGGVFILNTKHHPGATIWVDGDIFLVNGTKHPYVRDARHEAVRATRALTELAGFAVPAIAVVAVVGAHEGLTVKSQPGDGAVHVVPRRNLVNWLGGHRTIFSPEQVELVAEAARHSSAWS
jgi:Nuclease-related domain